MKKIAFILLLLMGTTALGYAQDIDEYYTKEISTRGIKQITEKIVTRVENSEPLRRTRVFTAR